jgi:hypothetical protein
MLGGNLLKSKKITLDREDINFNLRATTYQFS